MTAKTSRRRHLQVVSQSPLYGACSQLERDLLDLENQICDLDRAARIAFLLWMHDSENPDEEPLALHAIEHVEQLAAELRRTFHAAGAAADKAVQS